MSIRHALRVSYHFWLRRLHASARTEAEVIRAFHRLYYERGKIDGQAWAATRWRRRAVAQCPMDLLTLGRLIQEALPIAVLEIGTGQGGTTLFCADNGAAPVVTVDYHPHHVPFKTPGVYSVLGRSLDSAVILRVGELLPLQSALVLLDGDHRRDVVYEELLTYERYVRVGSHLVVCDTQFNGHPIAWDQGPGPWEAIDDFLARTREFVRDRDVEPLLSFNPGGWLRRVQPGTERRGAG